MAIHIRRREFIGLLCATATAWPGAAGGQQRPLVIGFLHQGSREPPSLMNAFRKGLSEVGFIDDRDFTIEDRAADGHYDRLPTLAADLIRGNAAVIAANFLPAALAAKAATRTIPIVFLSGSDPVSSGLVPSINWPVGNVTGIAPMFTLLGTKNLELLHEMTGGTVTTIGALTNLKNPNAEHQVQDLQAAARILGHTLLVVGASDEREIDESFAALRQRQIGALIVAADGFLISRKDQIVELAARHAVPVMYPLSQYVAAGGLMSYGANLPEAFRDTGIYVGKILKGAKPADLPVLQPTRIEFVINLKTAKALGLKVPDKLIAIADEVIE